MALLVILTLALPAMSAPVESPLVGLAQGYNLINTPFTHLTPLPKLFQPKVFESFESTVPAHVRPAEQGLKAVSSDSPSGSDMDAIAFYLDSVAKKKTRTAPSETVTDAAVALDKQATSALSKSKPKTPMTAAEKAKFTAELDALDKEAQDLENFLKTIEAKLDAMDRNKGQTVWQRVKKAFGAHINNKN